MTTKTTKTKLCNLLVGVGCLGVAALTFALVGCGGDGGTIAGALGGTLGMGGGGSSGGGLGSAFVGGSKGQYIDAAFKASQAVTIGDREEIALGQGVALALTNSAPLVEDPALTDYVTKVGLAVAMQSARSDFTYVFGVLDRPDIAAYSGPRGYVLITRGALASMQDEAELAGVLAHEVAHVARRHGLRSVQQRGLLNAGITAAGAEQGLGAFTDLVGNVTEDVINKGFSQAQETESDKDAVHLLVAAGYDPKAYVRFLERAKDMGASRGGVLSTHPGIDQRIGTVNKEIQNAQATGGQTNKDRYMRATAAVRGQ